MIPYTETVYHIHSYIATPLAELVRHFFTYYKIQCYVTRGGEDMYENDFSLRLAQLRTKKGVSARDMSLSIGQNHAYINNIESGKALPSMATFFYICEYLNISPSEFFDTDSKNPEKLQTLLQDLKQLDDKQLDSISEIVKGLIRR